jgi:hypothetical protein
VSAAPGERKEATQDRGLCPRLYAISRARCPECGHRWPWPGNVSTAAESPTVRPMVACPRCRLLVSVLEERCDERWWQYVTASPPMDGQRPTVSARPRIGLPARKKPAIYEARE